MMATTRIALLALAASLGAACATSPIYPVRVGGSAA